MAAARVGQMQPRLHRAALDEDSQDRAPPGSSHRLRDVATETSRRNPRSKTQISCTHLIPLTLLGRFDTILCMNVAAIQNALRERGFDAWLFYDHHHRD